MKSTDELLNLLQNLDIEEFKKEDSFQNINISEYLNELLQTQGLSPRDI